MYFKLMVLFCLVGTMIAQEKTFQLMPVPKEIKIRDGKFKIDENFTIGFSGNPGDRIYRAATRTLRRLAGRTGFFFKQSYLTADRNEQKDVMHINVARSGKVILHEDESYQLKIDEKGISLIAETDIGAIRGLETFLQLISANAKGYFVPGVEIYDQPRFAWRGLMIDAGRHFMPVEVIKRNLDGMAAVKMNVLHWHLTEDQGFRVECRTFPKLHELGSDGFYYTQDQIRDVIAYAADRGIRVVPEFDLPGHATSWFVGYPELASAPGPYQIERNWGIMDPTFNPASEETYQFLDKFFAEMSLIFPDDYIHIGGDENNGKQWDANEQIQTFMRENNIPDNHALQAYFNRRLQKILTDHGKKMVGWDEILHPDLPKDIVIQSWRGIESLVKATESGYQAMLSRGYYIDLIQPTDFHYLNDPNPKELQLDDDQKKLIIGGEATMWSEFVSPETIDSRIWPRTAAIAERLWSPAEINDVADMYRRLDRISFRLEELGLQHEKNFPMMLRRLTNNQNTESLKTFINVIEPVKIYNRNRLRPHTSYAPLTRVVDTARPDASVARKFNQMVNELLAMQNWDQALLGQIKQSLILWKNNHAELRGVINQSPVLKEIETLSSDLAMSAGVGLEALNYIAEEENPDQQWFDKARSVLTAARKPRGQTELMVIPGIELLVNYLTTD